MAQRRGKVGDQLEASQAPKLDRQGLLAALKAGTSIEGRSPGTSIRASNSA